MRVRIASISALLLGCGAGLYASPAPRVRQVRVEGNLRIPAATIRHYISVSPDSPFDPAAAEADVRKLHALGMFRQISVLTQNAGPEAIDLVFRMEELPFVSSLVVEGVSEGMEERIREVLHKENLDIRPSAPFQPSAGRRAAVAARGFLQSQGYPAASVGIDDERRGSAVRVRLKVRTGPRLDIGAVTFDGNDNLSDEELIRQMQYTRPASFLDCWMRKGSYVPEQLTEDVERVRRYYHSRGYAAVRFGQPEVKVSRLVSRRWFPVPLGSTQRDKLLIHIPVTEGTLFRLTSVRVDGDPKAAAEEISALQRSVVVPGPYDSSRLEELRRKMTGALGRAGYALAQVRLEQEVDDLLRAVRARYKIDAGDPALIGQIRFQGNLHLPDKFLRRELRAREGELFDSAKVEESLDRLNRSNLVKEVHQADVGLEFDGDRNALDITIKVKEKDRRGIFATGGTGGIGGGYLGIIYTAFNLLGLGDSLTLELDGGAAQSNILLDLVAQRFLGSPFLLALSGFHRYTNLNVASIIRGPEDAVAVFRRRSKGFRWGTGYSVTRAAQAGLGFSVERESIANAGPQGDATVVRRSELSPSFVLDSTSGSGPGTRGGRFMVSHSLVGSPFLQSVTVDRPSLHLARYVDDPSTEGRNAFAFQFYGSAARSRRGAPLPIDQRFFPGDELVRGFGRGALTPWVQSGDGSSTRVIPAGADTVLGLSAEYRVPIRGAVSGAAFLDLGWTRVDDRVAGEGIGTGTRLIKETNRLRRASAGGELRWQLPGLRQPARLIFAWNPLRLDRILEMPSSDPRRAVRFALGGIF